MRPIDKILRRRRYSRRRSPTTRRRPNRRHTLLPAPHCHDAPAAPDVLPDSDVDEVTPSVDPVVSGAAHDDAADDEARRRRLRHTAALAGVILVVVLAWFFGVKALRSAYRSDDTPTGVDTT